jgi:molybdopterin-guanine dinucleotide biosynthesis protein B
LKLVAFVGPSNSGKTSIVERLVPALSARGLRVGYLKHSSHGFQMDKKGKDTARIYESGALGVVIAGKKECAARLRDAGARTPEELARLFFADADLVLVEGYKDSGLPKIEVRPAEAPPLFPADDPRLIAILGSADDPRPQPRFDPGSAEDFERLVKFVAGA